eukprot:TRINITY_DN5543_c1_g1_i1.p1 TRINITY_DN5543_c1_g1~~TRINITY_DN5543_c1_g1_i1.p1  ORF type:complete len:121 (-),score=33.18 TRINITY_DN5543_c1_g1_i1:48-410(-)
MRDLYIRSGDAFALVYSLISKESLLEMIEIYDQILRVKDSNSATCIIIGNKCDLKEERQVSIDEAQLIAKKLKCEHIECSAKINYNVNQCFINLIRLFKTNRVIQNTQNSNHHKSICNIL